jgi:hypothetical protein
MSDIIGDAMSILGGSKKKAPAPASAPAPARGHAGTHGHAPTRTPVSIMESTPQVNINEMIDTAERRVKSELARYGLLHARLLEARELLNAGSDKNLVEGRVKFALNEAKVTLK